MPRSAKQTPLPAKFETFSEVVERQSKLCARLARAQSPGATPLARKLRKCRVGRRCRSAACAKCNRRFRIRLHRQITRAVPNGWDTLRISLIPRDCRVEIGCLSTVDLQKWAKSRQRSIARALPSGCRFFGGVDVSYNTFDNADPHWVLHLYGFVLAPTSLGFSKTGNKMRLRHSILKHCPVYQQPPGTVGKQRPLLVSSPWTRADFEENATYAHKSDGYRRSRYSEEKHATGKVSTNVARQGLDAASEVELALWLDRFPLGTRLLLVGLRRHGGFASFTLTRV